MKEMGALILIGIYFLPPGDMLRVFFFIQITRIKKLIFILLMKWIFDEQQKKGRGW